MSKFILDQSRFSMDIPSLVRRNTDAQIIISAVCFFAAAWLGHFLTFSGTTVIPAWPPSGIGFSLILLLGRRAWPGITIGSLVANLMAHWNNGALPTQAIVGISTCIAVANTIEVAVGYFLLRKLVGDTFPFRNARNAFQFLFVVLFMCATGAGIATGGLYFFQGIPSADVVQTFLTLWVGKAVGILLFTPFVLSCAYGSEMKLTTEKTIEISVFLLLAAGLFTLLKMEYLSAALERALPFLVLPFLLWLAFRFDLLVAVGAVLAMSLLSIYVTTRGSGPFALDTPYASVMLLQIFIGVMSISTLVLSATVRERMVAEKNLVEFNESLETRIDERTRALLAEITSRRQTEENLQRTNDELSKRNTELDNFVYSVSHDLRAPIASVLGLINLAKMDGDVAMKDVYLELINKSAMQQDHFIKEILDQSRNSRLEIKREEILFQPIIEDTFNQLRFSDGNLQEVNKVINIRQNKPFFSDKWRLKVILNNIISNSIRYRSGNNPCIEVNVEVNDDSALLEIMDNGKGIAREHLANVCRMFYRGTDHGAGSGLGLYIVKETIDKLNGTFTIDSEEGKGTRVLMQIPEVLN